MRAILWDLDGTLISTKRLYMEAYSRALKPYVGREFQPQDVRSVPIISELRFLRNLVADDYDSCVEDFRRHYAELHETHFDGIYDGVQETLAELRRRGLMLGIVTGKARTSWHVSMAAVDLGEFDVVIVDDDVSEPKPHPEGILRALRALDVDPAHAMYIGDSIGDVAAANDAGVLSAAALWSKQEGDRASFVDRMRQAGVQPAALLQQPRAVLDLL